MKRLYLVRHAKSDWSHTELDDFDRPLNKRGIRDALEMSKYMAKLDVLPDVVVTSPAMRARQTSEALVHAMHIPMDDIREDGRIYAASVSALLEVIHEWDETWNSVMMVGHNPGIAEISVMLTGEPVGRVPTCAVMEIELDATYWSDMLAGCGMLASKSTPKLIQDSA